MYFCYQGCSARYIWLPPSPPVPHIRSYPPVNNCQHFQNRPLHPVHFWPENSGAMRRVLVANLSATFHAPRTKFVHDLKVNQPNSQPNSNKNDRSRKKPTSFWTPHCQFCFRIMRDVKEFSDVTLACGDGQLVEAHKVILAGSGHTSFG